MKRASRGMSSFIKDVYSQFVESGGIDEGHAEIFQIFAETSEAGGGGSSIGGSGRRLLWFLWGWSKVNRSRLRGKTNRKKPVLRPKCPKTFPSQSWIAAVECIDVAATVLYSTVLPDLDPI
jgi:hypothetical protein